MQNKTANQPLKVETGQAVADAGRWETKQELPVETEILIPDYLPAVFKIVKCLLEPVIMQNTVSEHHWQCGGYLRCTVYYQSDEPGTHLYRTEQKYAFEKSVDLPEGDYLPGAAYLWGETEYCNCRAVSEHRIDIRGAYTLNAAVSMVEPVEFVASLQGCGVEQYRQKLSGMLCAVCEEHTFTAETAFPLPGANETILDITGTFVPGTSSVHTGQLDVSGTLAMQLCCRTADADPFAVHNKDVPVAQTIELPLAAEGDHAVLWGEILNCTLTAAEQEKDAVLSIQWKLHAELWRPVQYAAAVDAYSTICEMKLEKKSFHQFVSLANIDAALPVMIEDTLPDADVSVTGCFVSLCTPQLVAAEKGEECRISGRGTAHLFCTDERGELNCYDKTFQWFLPDALPGAIGQCFPHLHASLRRVVSSHTGNKARVELELNVNGMVLQRSLHSIISSAVPGEEYSRQGEPSLYIYYAQKGENIFEIARRYHARPDDLVTANQLSVPEGQCSCEVTTDEMCLLIPAAL